MKYLDASLQKLTTLLIAKVGNSPLPSPQGETVFLGY